MKCHRHYDNIFISPPNIVATNVFTFYSIDCYLTIPELSTGRMDPRVGSGRVGSGRVGSRFCRILAGRVGSGQHFGFISFLLIISWYLNRYQFSNTTFGLIDFHQYSINNHYFITK